MIVNARNGTCGCWCVGVCEVGDNIVLWVVS